MSNIAGVLQPTKFLLICIQIILLSIVLETKNEYIYNGILKTLPDTSDEYKTAYNYITGIAWPLLCLCLATLTMKTCGKFGLQGEQYHQGQRQQMLYQLESISREQ
eukprot:403352237